MNTWGPICQHCGGEIPGRPKKFCSAKCRNGAKYQRVRPDVPRDNVPRVCVVCSQAFISRRYSQIYCGRKCKTYALNARRIEKQRKTQAEPQVSPALIQRRAAAIRQRRLA